MRAELFLFPSTPEERQAFNCRKTAKEILAGNSPATMEVPDLSSTNIDAAFVGLRQFDQEVDRPTQKHWEIYTPRDPQYLESDDGAIRKEPPSDWKLFFHYRPDLARLLSGLQRVSLNKWQQEWFAHMDAIWYACTQAHRAYARELDALQPGFRFEKRAELWQHLNCLRLLRYVPHKGSHLAKPHTDRSATTFHVAESRSGFETRHGFATKAHESPTASDVLVFTGDQMEVITRGGIQRRWHQVVDTSKGEEERFAMVFFCKMYTGEL